MVVVSLAYWISVTHSSNCRLTRVIVTLQRQNDSSDLSVCPSELKRLQLFFRLDFILSDLPGVYAYLDNIVVLGSSQ